MEEEGQEEDPEMVVQKAAEFLGNQVAMDLLVLLRAAVVVVLNLTIE